MSGTASRPAGRRAPRPAVTVYVFAVGVAAIVAVAATIAAYGWPDGIGWVGAASFFVLLSAAEYLIVRYEYRGETMALSLFEAILAPAIVVLAPPTAVLVVAASQLVAGAGHRIRPVKTLFNTAQWTLAAAGGVGAYRAIGEGAIASTHTIAAVLVALAVMAALNTLLFTGIMRLTQEEAVPRILGQVGPPLLIGWLVNSSFGILFVLATSRSAASVALFLVPLIALHSAYRGHAAAAADRKRLARLNHALRMFSAPIEPTVAIERFLTEVRDCFDAHAVELVTPDEGGARIHHLGRDGVHRQTRIASGTRTLATALLARGEPVRIGPSSSDHELATMARTEGWRECIAAPVVAEGTMHGIVCAYDSSGLEGFEESESAVLQALAAEAAAMIRRGELLEQVLDERRRFAEIVTATSDGILTVGADGTIHTWNPALEQVTGYPADTMVGSKQLALLRPRDVDGQNVLLERWAEAEGPPRDLQIVDRSGTARWLSCTYTRVDETDGTPRTLIVVARDVTKIREVEQLKEDFVATVSHELRTPLTPIRGWATTLLERGDQLGPQERRIAAESIGRQAAHLERLITDLLQASQIERGIGIDRDAAVDVAAVIEKVITDLQPVPGRQIVLQADDHPIVALGNDLWIERILTNLISNALKYAPGPEPIEVFVQATARTVSVAVTDHGPGIHPADQTTIFERFRRLGDPHTRAQGGAGLGLYIARQLANSIGGTLTVESDLGSGATFTLELRRSGRLALVG